MSHVLIAVLFFLIGVLHVPDFPEQGFVKGDSTIATPSAEIILPIFDKTSSSSTTSATPKSRLNAFTDAYVRNTALSHSDYQKAYTDFLSKAGTIKDQGKRQRLLALQDRLGTLNARRMAWYATMLTNMSQVLDRADLWATTETQKRAVADADSALKTAMTVVAKQTGATYMFAFTSEARLKNDADSMRTQIAGDIIQVDILYRTAYAALQTAVRAVEPNPPGAATPIPTRATPISTVSAERNISTSTASAKTAITPTGIQKTSVTPTKGTTTL